MAATTKSSNERNKRWRERAFAEASSASHEVEGLFFAADSVENALRAIYASSSQDDLRGAAARIRDAAEKLVSNAVRLSATAECVLLLADLTRDES